MMKRIIAVAAVLVMTAALLMSTSRRLYLALKSSASFRIASLVERSATSRSVEAFACAR